MSVRLSSVQIVIAIMDVLEQSLAISSISSLFLQESSKHQSAPTSDMSFLKHIPGFRSRSKSRERRKLSRERAVSSERQHRIDHASETTPASYKVQHQPIVSIDLQDTSSEESSRKSHRIQQWLLHQAQRIEQIRHGLRKHRDSMFSNKEDIQKELKLASEKANEKVLGPHGEPIDPHVIDIFFMLHPAFGSDWRDSARWERHQAECLQHPRIVDHFFALYPPWWRDCARWELHRAKCLEYKCSICRPSGESAQRSSLPSKGQLPTAALSISPTGPKSSTRGNSSEDSFRSLVLVRPSSCNREDNGKYSVVKGAAGVAFDMVHTDVRQRHQENSLECSDQPPSRGQRNPVIEGRIKRIQEQPVRCSAVAKTLDPNRIPVPAVQDLKPADSSAFNPHDLAHMTGRPYSPCPLEQGRLPFPLSKNLQVPSALVANQDRCISPIPEWLQLQDSSPASSDDCVFAMSPPSSPSSSATIVQRGFESTIRLVGLDAEDRRALLDDVGRAVSKPSARRRTPLVATRVRRLQPRPAVELPPTLPASSHGDSSCRISTTAGEESLRSAAAAHPES